MGHFLEKGDGLYWEKQARGLFNLFDKIDRFIDKYHCESKEDLQIKSILKGIRHFRNVFTEK